MNVQHLISCVQLKLPLWDKTNKDHHNRYVLDKLWESVAKEMRSSRMRVRCKWKGLRDKYRIELKKMSSMNDFGPSAGPPWTPSWSYFNSLSFLKDQFDVEQKEKDILEDDVDSENEVRFEFADADSQQEKTVETSEEEFKTTWPKTEAATGLKGQYKPEDELENALMKIKKTDEDISFFQSLLPHIASLTPQRKLLLKMKIQETVYNFVYDN